MGLLGTVALHMCFAPHRIYPLAKSSVTREHPSNVTHSLLPGCHHAAMLRTWVAPSGC